MTVVSSLELTSSLVLSTAERVLPVLGPDPVPAPSEVTPGWLGFGFFVTLCVVTVLLWFNMRKQLGRIDFDDGSERDDRPAEAPGAGGTPSGTPADAPADSTVEPPASDRA